jgi:hypothetical protein
MIDTSIDILVKDRNGKNLLDTTNTVHFKSKDIRVFRLIKGEKEEVFQSNLNGHQNFLILKNEGNGETFLRFFPYEGEDNSIEKGTRSEETINYIQWKVDDVDTILCSITRMKSSVFCDKVIFNGVEKYNKDTYSTILWGGGEYKRLLSLVK